MEYRSNFRLADSQTMALLLVCFLFTFNLSAQNGIPQYEKKQHAAVERFLKLGYSRIIETRDGGYSELVGENALGQPMYYQTANNNVVTALKADILHSGSYGLVLDGQGAVVGLWENGQPRKAHEMFRTNTPPAVLQSRINYVSGQNQVVQRHATHVAGTIIGNQFSPSLTSPQPPESVRGVAYASTIKAWDWIDASSEMMAAAVPAGDHLKVANTSFGFNPLYMHPLEFGRYNDMAMQWDEIMCVNKEFQIVKSAGNAHDDVKINGYPQYSQVNILGGYDLLEGAGVAKNVLVVGSVNLENAAQVSGTYDGHIASGIGEPYSSWGPTDDGRIKPDVVTQGKDVLSGIETQNNGYGYYSGTSQAAAGVTGGIVLLQQYWKSPPFNNSDMLSSTIRALLIHSIDEIDERGPDYRNGWGVVNLQAAAHTIQQRGQSVIIREDEYLGQTIRINLPASGHEDLKVTLAWTDPAANVGVVDINNPNDAINEVTSKLVNDLDIRLVRYDANGNEDVTMVDPQLTAPDNNVLYPWIMRGSIAGNTQITLAARAGRGINSADNIEKIEVYKDMIPLTGGMFQLQITHKGTITPACLSSGQPFSLIVSGVSFCNDDLVFVQDQDNELADHTGTHVLAATIKSSNIIKSIQPTYPYTTPNLDFVEYHAAQFIELLPQGSEGFTAERGSDFLAELPCSGENSRIAYSPHDIQIILNDDKVDTVIRMEDNEMVIYPNPLINDILNIQFSLTRSSILVLAIYDMTGKLFIDDKTPKIYAPGINKKTIDLNRLPAGVYILKAGTIDRNRQIKFIKQ